MRTPRATSRGLGISTAATPSRDCPRIAPRRREAPAGCIQRTRRKCSMPAPRIARRAPMWRHRRDADEAVGKSSTGPAQAECAVFRKAAERGLQAGRQRRHHRYVACLSPLPARRRTAGLKLLFEVRCWRVWQLCAGSRNRGTWSDLPAPANCAPMGCSSRLRPMLGRASSTSVSAALDPIQKRQLAAATASCKTLLAPISAKGQATACDSPKRRLSQ